MGDLQASNFSQWLTALENGGGSLSDAQKEAIKAEATARGIHLNRRCSSCYRDALIQIVVQERKEAQAEKERKANKGEWVLREGLDVIFNGVRVNAETLTDALAERLHAKGFPNYMLWRKGDEAEN